MDKLKGLEKKLLEAGRIEKIETTIDRPAKILLAFRRGDNSRSS
jgi:hypothetical protein